MSKRTTQRANRKAYLRRLLKRGREAEAQAYASKHNLTECSGKGPLHSLHNNRYEKLGSQPPLSQVTDPPSPTLLPAAVLASVVIPGGAGVQGLASSGDGDTSRPKSENPQLQSSPALTAEMKLLAEEEPELYAALQADARCAVLTEAGRPVAAPYEQSRTQVSPAGSASPEQTGGVGGGMEPDKSKLGVVTENDKGACIARDGVYSPADKQPWPEETEAEFLRDLPNPRLSLIRLTDGRLASMWRGGVKRAGKSRLRVKNSHARDVDPIYQAV